MPAGAFNTPIAGASITTVYKPPYGVTPGAAGDATAPFALGSVAWITPALTNNRVVAKFCRCSAVIAIGGTSGIGSDGVATGAGVFTNDTGVALAIGDYVWLTAGLTPVLAADAEIAPETAAERKAREEREAKETPEERKARLDREAKETPEERKARVTAELLALRKAAPPVAETEEERRLREAEEAEYQKAERNHKKAHAHA